MPYTSLISAENAISLPHGVGERLAKNPPGLLLTARKHVKEIFSKEYIDKLSKNHNTDNLYVEFVVLTFDK